MTGHDGLSLSAEFNFSLICKQYSNMPGKLCNHLWIIFDKISSTTRTDKISTWLLVYGRFCEVVKSVRKCSIFTLFVLVRFCFTFF